jgi:hypothetical protein
MSYPWIPDENGKKIEIPKDLYSEIYKMIIKYKRQKGAPSIIYEPTTQKDIDEFFQHRK